MLGVHVIHNRVTVTLISDGNGLVDSICYRSTIEDAEILCERYFNNLPADVDRDEGRNSGNYHNNRWIIDVDLEVSVELIHKMMRQSVFKRWHLS